MFKPLMTLRSWTDSDVEILDLDNVTLVVIIDADGVGASGVVARPISVCVKLGRKTKC